MGNDNKKVSKLATYSTILLLMVIIVIIIAAMADDREKTFQSRIEETTQTNLTIQDEIVALKDENYQLKKKVEELEANASAQASANETNNLLTEIWTKYKEGNKNEAREAYKGIDSETVPEASKAYYDAIGTLINR